MKRIGLMTLAALVLAAVFAAWIDPALMQTVSDAVRACF